MTLPPAWVFIRFAVPGFHRWPDAPPRAAYLRERHRHLFNVEVRVAVTKDNRQVEFHELLAFARGLLITDADHGSASCEQLARRIATKVRAAYGRPTQVCVSEDGEGGAWVELP